MKKVVLLDPCRYTRQGILELLSQCPDAEIITVECDYQCDVYSLLYCLNATDFDVLILGEKSTLIDFSCDMEFIYYFYNFFGNRRKLLLLADRINLNLFGCVYGLQVETIDKRSAIPQILGCMQCLLGDEEYGVMRRISAPVLTPMQRQALASYLKGVPMVTLAKRSGKSPKTLSNHKRAAMRTLGVDRPQQLLTLE